MRRSVRSACRELEQLERIGSRERFDRNDLRLAEQKRSARARDSDIDLPCPIERLRVVIDDAVLIRVRLPVRRNRTRYSTANGCDDTWGGGSGFCD